MPPPLDFPEHGTPESEVLAEVAARLGKDPYTVERNFGVSYVGPPHSIAEQIRPLAAGSFFVEWARDMNPGADLLEKEAVRMLGSLLGHRDAVGFITSGGTESNLLALRLARNLGAKSEPEVVLPTTAHYSFRLGAELLGLRLREVDVDDAMRPDMRQVERLLNGNTVALVCSAPEGNYGQLDPVEEFADLAQRKGLYLHVDAAFGGFALPFLQRVGLPDPPVRLQPAGRLLDDDRRAQAGVAPGRHRLLPNPGRRHAGRNPRPRSPASTPSPPPSPAITPRRPGRSCAAWDARATSSRPGASWKS